MLNVPISRIKELPGLTYLKMIGINTMEDRPSGEKMFVKKRIVKYDSFDILNKNSSLKPSQFPVIGNCYSGGIVPEVITFLCTSMHNF